MSHYAVNTSSSVFEERYQDFSILFNRNIGRSVVCLPTAVWQAVKETDTGDFDQLVNILGKQSLHNLVDHGFIVDSSAPVLSSSPAYHKKLIAWFHVTNACNMGCTYCNVEKTKGSMDPEVGVKMVRRLVELGLKHNYQDVNISLAGGEPTINLKGVEKILDEVAANQNKIKINITIISNALKVKDELVELLIKHKVPVSISFDGFVSSRNNELANHTIFSNILKLKESGVSVFCLVTLDKTSLKSIEETTKLLVKHNIGFRLSLDKFMVASEQGQTYQEEICAKLDEVYEILQNNAAELPALSKFYRFGDTAISSTITRACAIEKDSLQLDTVGNVHYCHTDINVEKPVCNIFEVDPIEHFKRTTSSYSAVNTVDDIPICNTCEWKYQCGGGCPKLTLKTFGTVKEISPFCKIIKDTLPKIVKLHGVQMIDKYRKSHSLDRASL